MKKKLLLSLFCFLSLNADEIARIESIVNDITQLRVAYETCQEELHTVQNSKSPTETVTFNKEQFIAQYEEALKKQKEESENQIEILKKSIKSKENEIIYLKKQNDTNLSTKEEEIISLKNQINKSKKTKQISQKNTPIAPVSVSCVEENPFPVLQMKYPLVSDTNQEVVTENEAPKKREYKIQTTEPRAYKLSIQSDIYDAIDGAVYDNWEEGTSFTSNIKTDGWIKITGYFVERKWRKAKEELWIVEDNVVSKK